MLQECLQIIEEEGEKKRFQALYDTYVYKLQYFVEYIIKDKQLAEDAVQESFMYLAINFHEIDESDSNL